MGIRTVDMMRNKQRHHDASAINDIRDVLRQSHMGVGGGGG